MVIETAARSRLDVDALVREDAVHRRVYTDPAVFEEEQRKIFAGTWVFVGHESEVPQPGDYKTDEIARQPIILTRHSDGEVYVLFNTCRHRGARVCETPFGNSNFFRCPYHAWMYRNNGELVGVPYREGFGPDFDPADYPLVRLPRVGSYRGFVFASLNPDVPSLDEHLGRARHYLDILCDRAPDGAIALTKPLKYEYPGNWKLQLENYVDNYHPPYVHESAFDVSRRVPREKYGGTRPEFEGTRPRRQGYVERSIVHGHGMLDYKGGRVSWQNAWAHPDYLAVLAERHGPERAREIAETDYHIVIYPNLLLHTRLNQCRVVKPIAVDRTEVFTYPSKLVGAPDTVNEALIRGTAHHVSPGGEIQVDDLEIFARVQKGLQAQGMEWVILKLRDADERVNEHGEVEATKITEVIQRGYYREWRRLMSAP
jgi:benzoate/toluate 1,2-dioxygenase subunit alpha